MIIKIWKLDVKMTFLNGNLNEDVYMTQLEGFTSRDGSKVLLVANMRCNLDSK